MGSFFGMNFKYSRSVSSSTKRKRKFPFPSSVMKTVSFALMEMTLSCVITCEN